MGTSENSARVCGNDAQLEQSGWTVSLSVLTPLQKTGEAVGSHRDRDPSSLRKPDTFSHFIFLLEPCVSRKASGDEDKERC